MLKSFVQSILPLFEALVGARSLLLATIRDHCNPENVVPTMNFIKEVINEDVTYQKTPLDLRNQRTYAVKVVQTRFARLLMLTNSSLELAASLMLLGKLLRRPPRTYISMSQTSIVGQTLSAYLAR